MSHASRWRSPRSVDLSRLASAFAACVLLVLSMPLKAASTFEEADVYSIGCGGTTVALLVPVQANRCVLVTYPHPLRFATFDFHSTKANALANWAAIVEQIRRQGITNDCGPNDFSLQSDRNSFNDLWPTLDALRPTDVSSNVDIASEEHPYPFSHREMEFAASRAQAFLIVGANAQKYDAGFGSGRVPGAVVFLLNHGHLLLSTAEKPYLYAWDGAKFEFEKELEYVTRENVTSDTVQARLRGEVGANLPLPTAIAAAAPSPSSTTYATAATYDPTSDRSIQLLVEPKRFPSGGGECVTFKTHDQLRDCFARGSAILLASPGAKQYDAEFAEAHVMGAVVYPRFDSRVAFIARWDSVLEEYVDAGYSDNNWDNRICRECLWSPQIQANIRRYVEPNFTVLPSPDLKAYTTPEFKYYLMHDETAALLARYPSACRGVFPDYPPQGLSDEGFNPYLAGFFCDTTTARLVWKWVPEEAASYEIAGVIPNGTDEQHAAALLRHALGFRPAARLDIRGAIVDKAGLAEQAAQAAAAETARQAERAALIARIKRNVVLYGGGALAVIAPIALLVLVVRIARANARRRRMQVVQEEWNAAQERETTVADLLALAEEKVRAAEAQSREARAFREQVLRRADELLREVNIDE